MILTETELRRISRNNEKLEILSEKYKILKYDNGMKGKEITDMPGVGRIFDTSMSNIEEACDIEGEYRELSYETEVLIQRARRYIEQFPDWKLRMLLTLKFVNNMKTYEIGPALSLTERECETIIRVHFSNLF